MYKEKTSQCKTVLTLSRMCETTRYQTQVDFEPVGAVQCVR